MLYTGTVQTISLLVKEGGPMKLYNGFLPYYLRCGGHTVIIRSNSTRYFCSLMLPNILQVGMFICVEFIRKGYRKFFN